MGYSFDQEFQRCLLAATWGDGKFFAANGDLVRPEYFGDELHVGICGALHEYADRERRPPDLGAMLEELRAHVAPGRKWEEYVREAKKIHRRVGTNTAYYHQQAVDFARKQAVAEAVRSAYQHLETGELDVIAAKIQEATRIGERGPSLYYDHLAGITDRFKHYAGKANGQTVHRVRTGISPVDEETGGGLGPGELGVIEALPNYGKSTLLVHIGAQDLIFGENVLHVTLENSREVTAARYDAWLFGRPIKKIRKLPNRFRKKMAKLRDRLNSKLIISHFPTKTLTLPKLWALIAGADPRPDVVLVDYADNMKPPQKREERRFELTDIYEGMRRIAGESGVPIWTASQAHRPAFGVKLIGMEHLAECHEKAAIMDVGISINYTEEEHHRGELTLYVFKNRIGARGFSVECEVDWGTARIRPILEDE